MTKEDIRGKRRARKLALQALYQWHMSGTNLAEIEAQFSAANNMEKVDDVYFSTLLRGVVGELDALHAAMTPFLDRPWTDLTPIELSILRLSAFELLHRFEIPYRVVLDEAVNLARTFGAQDGHRYVNGVLHHLAQTARAVEVEHG